MSSINKKIGMAAAVIICVAGVLLVLAGSGMIGCSIGSGVYVGQVADDTQAIAKTAGFIGSIDRGTAPAVSSLVFNQAVAKKTSVGSTDGYLVSIPYGQNLYDEYFIDAGGYLHKAANC